MTAHSRNKGARVEREIALALELLTGIRFTRDLEQVRAAARSDLLPSDPAWPFAVEVKARAAGFGCEPAWQAQATAAAAAQRKLPAVIYRYNRRPARASIQLAALCPAWPADQWCDMTLEGFALVAADIMAERART